MGDKYGQAMICHCLCMSLRAPSFAINHDERCRMAQGVHTAAFSWHLLTFPGLISLKRSWYEALGKAESHFQTLLTSTATNEWKRLSNSTDISPSRKGKTRLLSVPELTDVVVHRQSVKSGEDIYRLTLEVATGEDSVTLEPWETVFSAPELRKEWDPAVVDAHLVETFDPSTRICKTNFTLGWPAKCVVFVAFMLNSDSFQPSRRCDNIALVPRPIHICRRLYLAATFARRASLPASVSAICSIQCILCVSLICLPSCLAHRL